MRICHRVRRSSSRGRWERRCVEILFPQQYNDGSEIPRKLRGRALKEIVDQFGAASFEPTAIEGYWHHEGILYTDSLSKIVIDVADTSGLRIERSFS